MSTFSLPCEGCKMRWYLPKERDSAVGHIGNCSRPKCPFVNQDVSWLVDNNIIFGSKPKEPVVVPVYSSHKKKKHQDFPTPVLADNEVKDEYPPLLHTRLKFPK